MYIVIINTVEGNFIKIIFILSYLYRIIYLIDPKKIKNKKNTLHCKIIMFIKITFSQIITLIADNKLMR